MSLFEYLLESQKLSNDYSMALIPVIVVAFVLVLLADLNNKKK